jgi:hypothetical protein
MILGAEPITRRRFSVGARGVDGRFVDGASTDAVISASVQPLEGKDRAILPEGDRSKDGIKVYTTSDLAPADQHVGTSGDQLIVDGVIFEVRNVVRERSIIPHYRAFALRLQEVSP